MKLKIESTKKKGFSPVTVSLEIDNIRDLRLLYHVLNYDDLLKQLEKGQDYNFGNFNEDIANEFAVFLAIIDDEIDSQGYEL